MIIIGQSKRMSYDEILHLNKQNSFALQLIQVIILSISALTESLFIA